MEQQLELFATGATGQLWTAEEVASYLRVHKDRVYDLVINHGLPAVRVGPRALRFDPSQIRTWVVDGGSASREDSAGER